MTSNFKKRATEAFSSRSGFIPYDEDTKRFLGATAAFCAAICTHEKYGDASGEVPRWLTLGGRSGSGKTMLAKEACRFVSGATFRSFTYEGENWETIFTSMLELSEIWRGGDWKTEAARNAYFLVIDDMGAERDESGFVRGKLAELLERRLGKWTLITTNLPTKKIAEDYDARIASRLIRGENRMLYTKAEDYAIRRLKEIQQQRKEQNEA